MKMGALAFTRPPPRLLIEAQIRAALEEDLGRAGDITSQLAIAPGTHATARLVARKPGRIAGLICAEIAFQLVDPSVTFDVALADGSDVLSRLIWGGRNAFGGVAVAMAVTIVVGVLWGAVSGYWSTYVGTTLMRVADIMIAFPTMVLAVAIIFERFLALRRSQVVPRGFLRGLNVAAGRLTYEPVARDQGVEFTPPHEVLQSVSAA